MLNKKKESWGQVTAILSALLIVVSAGIGYGKLAQKSNQNQKRIEFVENRNYVEHKEILDEMKAVRVILNQINNKTKPCINPLKPSN